MELKIRRKKAVQFYSLVVRPRALMRVFRAWSIRYHEKHKAFRDMQLAVAHYTETARRKAVKWMRRQATFRRAWVRGSVVACVSLRVVPQVLCSPCVPCLPAARCKGVVSKAPASSQLGAVARVAQAHVAPSPPAGAAAVRAPFPLPALL